MGGRGNLMLQSLTFRSIGYRFLPIGLLGGIIALKGGLVLVYFLDIKYLHLIPGVEIQCPFFFMNGLT